VVRHNWFRQPYLVRHWRSSVVRLVGVVPLLPERQQARYWQDEDEDYRHEADHGDQRAGKRDRRECCRDRQCGPPGEGIRLALGCTDDWGWGSLASKAASTNAFPSWGLVRIAGSFLPAPSRSLGV
jgi:hypothetical protein